MSVLENIEVAIYKYFKTTNSTKETFFNPVFVLLATTSLFVLFISYSNHFTNDFQFDDSHTIVENHSIMDIDIVRFFTDGSTFSTLPTNQSYRPYTTAENAIDYQISKGNSKAFHIHIFATFVIVCILLLLFVKKILDRINFSNRNPYWALLVSSVFGLLCANAETVNYIIQRSEIVACLYILAGFVAYLHGGAWKRFYLYLIFPLIGFFAKEMALVFSPLLFLYVLIFDENTDLLHFYKSEQLIKIYKSFLKILPSFILTVAFLPFYAAMLPETFSSGGYDRIKYLITQPMVMCHYIATYFVPYNLSADTDWKPFETLADYRAIIGIVCIISIVYLALKTSRNKETRLFSFGLLWFFIALLPTSSLVPFSEVLNDHRCFIPYVGLTISFVFGLRYLAVTYFRTLIVKAWARNLVTIFCVLFLGANAFGVRERNKVWKDQISLWGDVAVKSPDNGRGLMNYGLALMAKADYANAEIYFNKAAVLNPDYSTVYINLGVLKNAIGDNDAAEMYYKRALGCSTVNHSSHYFYGKYLYEQTRYQEALEHLKIAYKMSPSYVETHLLMYSIYHKLERWADMEELVSTVLGVNPNDRNALNFKDIASRRQTFLASQELEAKKAPSAEKFLSLSMLYFQKQQFQKCIEAAERALEIKGDYPEAYNNIGIAYVSLKQYAKGINAYKNALAIRPDYQLTLNNLMYAQQLQNSPVDSRGKSAAEYINLSLVYYGRGEYIKCIEAAEKSNLIQPSAAAYNNICSAYNQLRLYNKAIEACDLALKLDPKHEFAKGNRAYASQKLITN